FGVNQTRTPERQRGPSSDASSSFSVGLVKRPLGLRFEEREVATKVGAAVRTLRIREVQKAGWGERQGLQAKDEIVCVGRTPVSVLLASSNFTGRGYRVEDAEERHREQMKNHEDIALEKDRKCMRLLVNASLNGTAEIFDCCPFSVLIYRKKAMPTTAVSSGTADVDSKTPAEQLQEVSKRAENKNVKPVADCETLLRSLPRKWQAYVRPSGSVVDGNPSTPSMRPGAGAQDEFAPTVEQQSAAASSSILTSSRRRGKDEIGDETGALPSQKKDAGWGKNFLRGGIIAQKPTFTPWFQQLRWVEAKPCRSLNLPVVLRSRR
ncbi:unnamed protein product, partial [Amoebophrya sp. A25]